jgi:hypothetical protein
LGRTYETAGRFSGNVMKRFHFQLRDLRKYNSRRLRSAAVLVGWLAMGSHCFAQTRVVAWGAGTTVATPPDYNNYGQSIVPAGLTNAVYVAAGWRHSLALRSDGTILGWGDDSSGQTDLPPGTNYLTLACGSLHSLALRDDGTLVATGDDFYGQTDFPAGLSNVVAIACGFYHSLALKSDGMVVAWGASANTRPVGTNPNYGQTIVPAGLSNVVAIAAGGYHSVALKADGTVIGWGDFKDVLPGVSNLVSIATGAQADLAIRAGKTVLVWGGNTYGQTNVPAGLSNVVAVAAGGWHELALKTNGTVVAWGAGTGGNTYVDCGQDLVPAGLSNVIQVAAGQVNSLALVGSDPPVTQGWLTLPALGTNGFGVRLQPTHNGRVYQLQFSSGLGQNLWESLPLAAGTGASLEWTNQTSANQKFYRILQW